ncbi:MAG: glycosyltransferase [Acidobacteriaceae bacterium]|nr:glycosyltransferase [Acidobacteriaceae bacterium]
MRPQVSVITPLYNYAEYVAWTIKSVLKQTCQSFEHILVDDGSTDESAEVVRPFLSDDRIRLIELGKNCGFSVAKNIGIEASRADYITTIDADDMLTRDSLQLRLDYLQQHQQYDGVHGRVYICTDAGDATERTHELAEDPWHPQRMREHAARGSDTPWEAVHAQGVLCRRSVYERVGLYDEEMRWKADREMWYRMMHHGCRLGYLDAFVAIYRLHGRNMSQSEERRRSNIEEVFRRKCRERGGSRLPDDVKRLAPLPPRGLTVD